MYIKVKQKSLSLLFLFCLMFISTGCNLGDQLSLKSGQLTHAGFDFSVGEIEENWEINDGYLVWWTPGGEEHPEYSRDENIWWNNMELDTENYQPQVHCYGKVSINVAVEAGLANVTWDESPILPLLTDNVYAVRCRDGYAIFVVEEIQLPESGESFIEPYANIKYIYSTSVDFK